MNNKWRWCLVVIILTVTMMMMSGVECHNVMMNGESHKFNDSSAMTIISQSQLIQFHWITTGACILFIVISGLFITTCAKYYNSTLPIYYQLFKRSIITTKYPLINDLIRFSFGEVMLIFLYMCCMLSWFMFGFIYEKRPHAMVAKVAKGMGYVTVFNMSLVLLPVSRHSIWTWIFNISYERAVRFHRMLGVSTLLFVTIHFITYAVNAKHKSGSIHKLFLWNNSSGHVNNLSGFISWCAMVALTITSLPVIRRYIWDLFQFCHVFFGIMSFVFAHFHLPYQLIVPFTTFSIVLYVADVLIRYIAYMGNIHFNRNGFWSVRRCEIVPCTDKSVGITTVYLYLDRSTNIVNLFHSTFNSEKTKLLINDHHEEQERKVEREMQRSILGKYIHLWIWEISAWESHPFSITELTLPDRHTVKMRLDVKETGKVNGAWAGRLNWLADSDEPVSVLARFDGPFGSVTVPLDQPSQIVKYDAVLMFAGGIGVTALSSMMHYCSQYNPNTQLIWVVRTRNHMRLLPSLADHKNVVTYVTRDNDSSHSTGENYIAGRPNFEKIIERELEKIESEMERNIAVAICGPTPLVVDVLCACKRIESNQRGIQFHIHTECFEL